MQGPQHRIWTVSSSRFESNVQQLCADHLVLTSGDTYRYNKHFAIPGERYVTFLMLKQPIPGLSHPSGEATKLGGTVSFLIQYSAYSEQGLRSEAHTFCTLTEGRAALDLNTLLRFIHLIEQRKAYSLLLELRHSHFRDSPVSLAKITARLDEMKQQEMAQLKTEQQMLRVHRAGTPLHEPYVVNAVMQGSPYQVDDICQKLIEEFVPPAAQRQVLQQTIREGLLLRDEQEEEQSQPHLSERRMTKAVQRLLCID